MPLFHYTAITQQGSKKKGVIEADTLKHARESLRQKQLIALEVAMTDQVKTRRVTVSRKQSLSVKEIALVTRQLATLIAAGLPLEEVLTAVAEQTEKPKARHLLISVRNRVIEGHSLATALREYPHAFPPLYCATIAAGEKSGHLDKILQRLADFVEQQYQTRQKIMHALIYPSIMVLVAIGIVGFLLEFVVPKMITVYSSSKQTLPLLTQLLISMSSGLQRYGVYLLIGLVIALFLFFRELKNNPVFREKVHALLLRLPILGNAIKVTNTARFARTFAILFSSGVSVIEAMNISARLITNLPIRHSVEAAAQRVREGANIHLALKQTHYFPPMSIHLIASGEASGQLESMLERAANNQDADITRLIETSLALFEPAIILVMGAIVLFIVLAVLLPIFQLNQFTG
jgi:general secretion pathway protein F